jgi:hypothetical protein
VINNCDAPIRRLPRLLHQKLGRAQIRMPKSRAKAESEVSRLFDLKAKRVEEIYKVEEERSRFGRTVITMNKAWRGVTGATIKLRESLQNGK